MNLATNISATVVLLLLDFLWIRTVMGPKYQTMVRVIQGHDLRMRPYAAVLAYVLMVVGLNMFVLPHIRKDYELVDSLRYGFTFGVVLYGVYDFTAGAVFREWDMKLATVDILWGGFVYFMAAYIGSMIGTRVQS